MVRIVKTVKEFGSTTIGTSSQTLETQAIKALGDVLSWGMHTIHTYSDTTGTEHAEPTTVPAGSTTGATVARLIRRVSIKDNANTDLFEAQGTDLTNYAYLLSIADPNEFLFDRGLQEDYTDFTATGATDTDTIIFPQSILLKDLPASLEIELGTLSDFYSTVGDGASVISTLTVWVRYAPPQGSGFTVRVKAFNVTAFGSDQDIAHLLPENITILQLAFMADTPNGVLAGNQDSTNIDRISFRRGSNEEIESQRLVILNDWVDQVYTGDRATGLNVIPTDAFVKTASTFFNFDINTTISPRIYYVYK